MQAGLQVPHCMLSYPTSSFLCRCTWQIHDHWDGRNKDARYHV